MGSDDVNAVLHYLATNRTALWALQTGDRGTLSEEIKEGAKRYNVVFRENTDPVRLIATWATNSSCPKGLKDAMDEYRRQRQQVRKERTAFLTRTRLYIAPGLQIRRRAALKIITVRKIPSSYPSYGTIIADTREIYDKWYPHFAHGKQADCRLKRLPLQILDDRLLQIDIGPNESVLLKDESGALLGFVLRDFCPDRGLLDWATATAKLQIPVRRNIRKEDTGKLVLMGYSAGSRSKTMFDWVRNITKKMTEDEKARNDMAGSVLFAVAWQLMKSQVPQEVIDDFNDFVSSLGIRRMDRCSEKTSKEEESTGNVHREANVKVTICDTKGGRGRLGFAMDDKEFEFTDVQLAPPSGVVGQNYSRSAEAKGADFLMANIGVRIRQASNTAIGWRPNCNHGTSLPNCNPQDENPDFEQTGLAFVTSNRLASAWRKYQAGVISREEAEREAAVEETAEDDGDGEK
ncbi:hypothetical protein H0H93_003968 [Arthromyces matolae]|nr:hypothetical protein H0H93_003968 [Arthromyces matolae]